MLCTLCVHIFFCKFTHDSNLNASGRRNNNSLPHEVYNIHSAVAHLLKRGERLFHVVVLFLWLHLCLKPVIQTHTFNEYINQMHDSRVSWPNVIDVFCNSHTTSPLQLLLFPSRPLELPKIVWKTWQTRFWNCKTAWTHDKISSINLTQRMQNYAGEHFRLSSQLFSFVCYSVLFAFFSISYFSLG